MKAIGASRRQIARIYRRTTLLLGGLGAIVGAILGVVLANVLVGLLRDRCSTASTRGFARRSGRS